MIHAYMLRLCHIILQGMHVRIGLDDSTRNSWFYEFGYLNIDSHRFFNNSNVFHETNQLMRHNTIYYIIQENKTNYNLKILIYKIRLKTSISCILVNKCIFNSSSHFAKLESYDYGKERYQRAAKLQHHRKTDNSIFFFAIKLSNETNTQIETRFP